MSEWITFGEAALRFLFLNWALQATVILTAGLLLSRLPRLAPATRHTVLIASLAGAVLAPAATAARWAVRPYLKAEQASTQVRFLEWSLPARTPRATAPAGKPAAPAVPSQVGWLLLAGWSVVAASRVGWLACGIASARRLLRGAQPADVEALYSACGSALADVPVLENARVTVPSVVGLRRPRILLPEGLAGTLDPRALRDVLFHEEAHARRRDPAFLAAGAFCHALLFWHPLAGLARRRMEAAAEDACDAYVLSRGVEPTAYARTLLRVLEHSRPRRSAVTCLLGRAPAGPGAAGELKRRIVLILAGGPRVSRPASLAAATALTGFVSVTALAEAGTRPALPARRPPAAPVIAHRGAGSPPSGRRPLARSGRVPVARLTARKPVRQLAVRLSLPTPAPAELEAQVPSPVEAVPVAEPALAQVRMVAPRDGRTVVFLLDVSSSMRPYQEEAQRQLLALAAGLSPGDRLNVLTFAAGVDRFALEPIPAMGGNLEGIRHWLEDLPPQSGTNLSAGLQAALGTPGVTRIVLLSDGEAWQSPQARASLVSLVERENRSGARIEELVLKPAEHPVPHLLPDLPPLQHPGRTLDATERPDLETQ